MFTCMHLHTDLITTCQGNVGKLTKCQANEGKTCYEKLCIFNLIFEATHVFNSIIIAQYPMGDTFFQCFSLLYCTVIFCYYTVSVRDVGNHTWGQVL